MRATTTKKSEFAVEEAAAAIVRAVLPPKMTAAVLYGSEDLRIEKIDVPAVAADEVLLRVRCCHPQGGGAMPPLRRAAI